METERAAPELRLLFGALGFNRRPSLDEVIEAVQSTVGDDTFAIEVPMAGTPRDQILELHELASAFLARRRSFLSTLALGRNRLLKEIARDRPARLEEFKELLRKAAEAHAGNVMLEGYLRRLEGRLNTSAPAFMDWESLEKARGIVKGEPADAVEDCERLYGG